MEQLYGAGVLMKVSLMQLLHTFWSTYEALVEYSKETWARVNPDSPVPFMSDITNEENKESYIDNVMIKAQLCDAGTLQNRC